MLLSKAYREEIFFYLGMIVTNEIQLEVPQEHQKRRQSITYPNDI
jgi:hypothetical protein